MAALQSADSSMADAISSMIVRVQGLDATSRRAAREELEHLIAALVLLQHDDNLPLRNLRASLEPGTPVKLVGLAKVELNGCVGCIGPNGFATDTNRYNVDIRQSCTVPYRTVP